MCCVHVECSLIHCLHKSFTRSSLCFAYYSVFTFSKIRCLGDVLLYLGNIAGIPVAKCCSLLLSTFFLKDYRHSVWILKRLCQSHVSVFSWLDCFNSHLFPAAQSSRFLLVQNAAGRCSQRTGRGKRITLILASLHWLPVNFRINYKTMLFNFLAPTWFAPGYCISLSFYPHVNLNVPSNVWIDPETAVTKSRWGLKMFYDSVLKLWTEFSCETIDYCPHSDF